MRDRIATLRRPLPAVLGTAALAVVSVATAAALNHSPEPAKNASGAGLAALSLALPEHHDAPQAEAKPDPLLTAPAEKVLPYSFQLQTTFYNCGPAATRMALSTSISPPSQSDLAGVLGTTVNGTNSADDTTHGLNRVLGRDVYKTHWIPGEDATGEEAEQLQRNVVNAIGDGRGVVANIVGGVTDMAGTYHEFGGGHYVAIIGYRDRGRQVKVADSSGMFGPGSYWVETYPMASWIGHRGYSA
ncbi:MAG TPA: C39 family peptidase [Dactylosporangium sp.]|jgi:hypothetical protein|nr:C39 family peptidase [Dactylosporangium sp.]